MRKLWTKKEIKLLGTNTDKAIAKLIGRTKAAVEIKRRKQGVSPFVLYRFVPTLAQKRQLGKHTDLELSRSWGVTRLTVLKARRKLGIPAYKAD